MTFVRFVRKGYIPGSFSCTKIPSESPKRHTVDMTFANSVSAFQIKCEYVFISISETYIRVEILLSCQNHLQMVFLGELQQLRKQQEFHYFRDNLRVCGNRVDVLCYIDESLDSPVTILSRNCRTESCYLDC